MTTDTARPLAALVEIERGEETPWIVWDAECKCWVFDDRDMFIDSRERYEDVTIVYAEDLVHGNVVTLALIAELCRRRAAALDLEVGVVYQADGRVSIRVNYSGEWFRGEEASAWLKALLAHAEANRAATDGGKEIE